MVKMRLLRKITGYASPQSSDGVPDYDKEHMKMEELENNALSFVVDIFLMFSRTTLQKGTVRMLQMLKAKGKKVAIFTNGGKRRVLKEVNAAGIAGYIDVLLSARDIHAFKPDPKGINVIVHHLKANKARTIYVGDMIDDIMAARHAKVSICSLSDGFDRDRDLELERPDYIFRTVEEFIRNL